MARDKGPSPQSDDLWRAAYTQVKAVEAFEIFKNGKSFFSGLVVLVKKMLRALSEMWMNLFYFWFLDCKLTLSLLFIFIYDHLWLCIFMGGSINVDNEQLFVCSMGRKV